MKKIAIVGSRSIKRVNIAEYVSPDDEIVSGGAEGVDSCAAEYAIEHGMKLTEFLPQYDTYGKAAPVLRNKEIVKYADLVLVFWDGRSNGSRSVIEFAKSIGKPCRIILCEPDRA